MAAGWYFGKASAGQRAREPQVEKFFGADVVANFANALVREGVQNSLDARDDGALAVTDPVQVRIRLGTVTVKQDVQPFVLNLWDHLEAQDADRFPDRPSTVLPCRFLAFEDFNTRGLCGSYEQVWPDESPDNAFYNFFRAEGHSSKHEKARGRHGLGKNVFARASQARCFFGLTRRADDKRVLLMGAAILRTHKVGEQRYVPDGWFGVLREADGFVLPVTSPAKVAEFADTFDLLRHSTGANGLSIIVPWLDPSITRAAVIEAVVRGYFYPILAGQLVVTVFDGEADPISVDAGSIRSVTEQCGPSVNIALAPMFDLASFALTALAGPVQEAAKPPSKPEWKPDLIPEAVKTYLRDELQAQKPVALRVPVRVKGKKAKEVEQLSHFDLFMVRHTGSADDDVATFVREGLIVSDARPAPRLASGHWSSSIREHWRHSWAMPKTRLTLSGKSHSWMTGTPTPTIVSVSLCTRYLRCWVFSTPTSTSRTSRSGLTCFRSRPTSRKSNYP